MKTKTASKPDFAGAQEVYSSLDAEGKITCGNRAEEPGQVHLAEHEELVAIWRGTFLPEDWKTPCALLEVEGALLLLGLSIDLVEKFSRIGIPDERNLPQPPADVREPWVWLQFIGTRDVPNTDRSINRWRMKADFR